MIRLRLVIAVAAGLLLTGGAAVAALLPGDAPSREGVTLQADAQARASGQQVLGGTREPGVPSVQRLRHDEVDFTVTVAPARPGPNLVRIDASYAGDAHREHRRLPFLVGTTEDDAAGTLVRARPRPGASGQWAVVDLPEGSATVLVTHGPEHRVPFAVDTGTATPDTAAWTGPDGAECLDVATAAVLGGGAAPGACPSEALPDADATALEATVGQLASRGVTELALQSDDSPRSRAAREAVTAAAESDGLRVVEPGAAPGARNALLVLGGWGSAAEALTATSRLPLREQPVRSDGTWLAPWLLTPQVVDSTSGAVVALDFDIRDEAAQRYSQTLATIFPGQSPTSSGFRAWRAGRNDDAGHSDDLTLYAASRAAYMPARPGHAGHESEVAWFPGGTVTPVGSLPAPPDPQ